MSDGGRMGTTDREGLGKVVRQAWVDYCRETGDDKPSHVAPWDDLGEWDREADRRIGEAVATALAGPGGDGASVRGCARGSTAHEEWVAHLAEWAAHVATVLRTPYTDRMVEDSVLAGMLENALAAAGATGEGGGGQ